MRFVNNYFNDAANAAVAFSFHRGFVAVVSSRYKKKKENIVPQLLLFGIVYSLIYAIDSSKWLTKVKSNSDKKE